MTNLEILKSRHSVRTFTPADVPHDIIVKLQSEITMINTHEAGMKFQLCVNDSNPFDGFKKSYGFFKNAKNYIAVVVDTAYKHTYQRAGYFAQQIVIKATTLGLGTCYVGGTYDKKSISARIRVGEKLLFIILFGYEDHQPQRLMARIGYNLIHLKKKALHDFITIDSEEEYLKFPKLHEAVEAVACSPSSLNKRPARITCKNGEIHMLINSDNEKEFIDLGIAQYNFQFIMPGEWEWGIPSKFLPL